MQRLLVNPGSPGAWEIELKEGTTRLGRGADNDFQIDDPSVSTFHCQIVPDESGIRVIDLQSTNGTFVDGTRIQETVLQAGQWLRLGNVTLQLTEGSNNGPATPQVEPAVAAPLNSNAADPTTPN